MRSFVAASILVVSCATVSACKARQQPQSGEPASLTFETVPRPITGSVPSRDPKLVTEASGALYVLAVFGAPHPDHLGVWTSHTGGDSFEGPIPVSDPAAAVMSHGENSPSFVFENGTALAIWEQRGSAGNDLMFARAPNWSWHFQPPAKLTSKPTPSLNGFSSLAARGNDAYAMWLDARDRDNAPGTFSVYSRRISLNDGSLGAEVRVARNVCPCCRPAVAVGEDGTIYATWREVFQNSIRDIVLASSSDHGATFSSPVRVATDEWKVEGCPHSGPAINARNGTISVSWFTAPQGKTAGLRLAVSHDAGKTFDQPALLSTDLSMPNHPAIASSDRLLVAFQGRRQPNEGRWGMLQPFLSSGAGAPVAIPSAEPATYPVIAAVPGTTQLFAAWTADSGHTTRAMLARGERTGAQ